MSYQERRAIVSLISSVVITAIYSAVMMQRYPTGNPYAPEVFHFWGSFFLLLILVSIVSRIIIVIVFSIINTVTMNDGEPSIMDERDRLIELRAFRNAGYVFIVGVFVAMGSLVFSMLPATMFVILICFGVVAGMISDVSEFLFYRRGF